MTFDDAFSITYARIPGTLTGRTATSRCTIAEGCPWTMSVVLSWGSEGAQGLSMRDQALAHAEHEHGVDPASLAPPPEYDDD